MGDWADDYGGYDGLDHQHFMEDRANERRAQRAKLLTPYAPPEYAIKTHWEKDGRIGVIVCIVRPDGGVHVLQDFIDPPQRKPLTVEQIDRCIEAADTKWADAFVSVEWARHLTKAIEAAHGIKEPAK
jgi:hypothetical protein